MKQVQHDALVVVKKQLESLQVREMAGLMGWFSIGVVSKSGRLTNGGIASKFI